MGMMKRNDGCEIIMHVFLLGKNSNSILLPSWIEDEAKNQRQGLRCTGERGGDFSHFPHLVSGGGGHWDNDGVDFGICHVKMCFFASINITTIFLVKTYLCFS